MRLMVGVLAFGAGVFASKYFVPKVAVAVEKMKHDTEVIISNEAIIKQMCVDQIVRWYYGTTKPLRLGTRFPWLRLDWLMQKATA